MNKAFLLDKLDRATDKATAYAIQRGSLLSVNSKSMLIGRVLVEKNTTGTYDVLLFDRTPLFNNISVFDVAVIIAQRYHKNELGAVRQVLHLEERFSKYHTDMMHYLHCMRSAKKDHDDERMAILEDKFQMAEQCARDTRDKISSFKRTK